MSIILIRMKKAEKGQIGIVYSVPGLKSLVRSVNGLSTCLVNNDDLPKVMDMLKEYEPYSLHFKSEQHLLLYSNVQDKLHNFLGIERGERSQEIVDSLVPMLAIPCKQ